MFLRKMNMATKSGADKNRAQEGQPRRDGSLPRGGLTGLIQGPLGGEKGKRRHIVQRRWMQQCPDMGVREWESKFTIPLL